MTNEIKKSLVAKPEALNKFMFNLITGLFIIPVMAYGFLVIALTVLMLPFFVVYIASVWPFSNLEEKK